jgi:peptide deformylase
MLIVETNQIPLAKDVIDVPVSNPVSVYKICLELELLCLKEGGIGISAVQAGIPWNLFLVRGDGTCPLVPKGQFRSFANCHYQPIGESQVTSIEGCLSLKKEGRIRQFRVPRHETIQVTGSVLYFKKQVLQQEPIDVQLNMNQQGIVFAHEIDHQLGILISDIGTETLIW